MLETERLLLRLPEEADAAALVPLFSDAEAMRYIGLGETGGLEDSVEQVAKMKRGWNEDGFGRFIVLRKVDRAVVGRVGLLAWDPAVWRNGTRAEIGAHAELELGWMVLPSAWGNGYATEAAAEVRDWAFDELRPERLISLIHPENERSARVAVKIGEHLEREVMTQRGVPAQLWTLTVS
jgi:RimJ/RimL family protein N-acetyltransferase